MLGPITSIVQGMFAISQGNYLEGGIRIVSGFGQTALAASTGGLSLGASVLAMAGEEILVRGLSLNNSGAGSTTNANDSSFFVDPKGNKTVFSPQDTVSVYANNQGKTNINAGSSGVEDLLKQVIAKLEDLGNRPVQMDGVTVSNHLAYINSRKNPRSV